MKLLKQKQPMTEADLIQARDRLLKLNQIQTAAREEELQIREYLTDKLYPKDKEEGAVTLTPYGMKVAITVNLRRTISREDADKLTTEKPELATACLRWTPEVRVAEFKKNEKELAGYIVTKPAPPTVSFK